MASDRGLRPCSYHAPIYVKGCTRCASRRLSELVFDFLEVPMILHAIFWALWFGIGVLVGAALS